MYNFGDEKRWKKHDGRPILTKDYWNETKLAFSIYLEPALLGCLAGRAVAHWLRTRGMVEILMLGVLQPDGSGCRNSDLQSSRTMSKPRKELYLIQAVSWLRGTDGGSEADLRSRLWWKTRAGIPRSSAAEGILHPNPIPPPHDPSWGSQLIDWPRSPGRPVRHSPPSSLSPSSSLSSSSSTSQLAALAIYKNWDGSLGPQSLQNPLPTAHCL